MLVDIDDEYSSLTIDILSGVRMDQTVIGNGNNDDGGSYRPDCVMCHGSGDCSECGGDGYTWSFGMDREKRNCMKCNANGKR